jgi:phospholipid/cholesterol/gamma-HCH transport system permease protein
MTTGRSSAGRDTGRPPTVTARAGPEGEWLVELSGQWVLDLPPADRKGIAPPDWSAIRTLRLRCEGLDLWDSTLIVLLLALVDQAESNGVEVDLSGLPEGARGLLALAKAVPERTSAHREPTTTGMVARVGTQTLAVVDTSVTVLGFIGELVMAFGRLLMGQARFRGADLWLFIQRCGIGALGIVSLISLLVGLILAFVGSVQLALFGAQIYVANAVAIGMLREMGALMTAVIMAGRTGAAYAAQLGSMQVNEEIDALRTLGVSPVDFLVLPRVLALTLMIPLLTIYANALGILGGMVVGITLFDIPPVQYLNQTRDGVYLSDLLVGLFMSVVFGIIIGIAGCWQGLNSGRSSAAVGEAATAAVVTSIVAIVVANSIITIVTTQLGI